MPKYIDADAFVKENREWYCAQCEKRKGMKRGKLQFVHEIGGVPCRACDVDDIISDIEDFPAADVEPVRHGRWIDKSDDEYAYGENVYQCSACGEEWDILEGTPKQNSYHYCPNCGAKMLPEPPKEDKSGEDL